MLTLSLTNRIATLWRSCATISSSSFPVSRLTCLPSFVITSKESLCHPPKVSTTRGMNTIPSASFTVFPHFDVKCVLDSFFSFPGDLSNQLLLQRIDNGNIKRSIFAIGPEGKQDIGRAVIAAREKPCRLFSRTQSCLRCCRKYRLNTFFTKLGFPIAIRFWKSIGQMCNL